MPAFAGSMRVQRSPVRRIWLVVVPPWADRDLRVVLAARVGMSVGRTVASIVTAAYLAEIGFSAIEIRL
ncbi:MAG: hypothetical protein ACRDXC_07995 [Acidimicrobiales bacterium]